MNSEGIHSSSEEENSGGLLTACFLAAGGGLAIGVIGAAFRASLLMAEDWRVQLTQHAHAWPWIGWLIPVGLGVAGAVIARAMVRMAPLASGSGVQHVEAIMRGEAGRAPLRTLPIKFFGGLFAIGGGLALGREGPTIQMGAVIGTELGKRFRQVAQCVRDLQAALGGAGLAVAFNAPMGGALFVFEEVAKSFRLRLTVLTIIGITAAITSCRWVLGNKPDFDVASFAPGTVSGLLGFLLLGCFLGLLGAAYNRTSLFAIDLLASLKKLPVEVRAGLVGLLVGIVGWFSPGMAGGGDGITQEVLSSGLPLGFLFLVIVIRWILGPLSYAAGTPGGIFSPLLLVGACLGHLFAVCWNEMVPLEMALAPAACAVAGMASFFTGIVRAPFTGVILIMEMTASPQLLVPMMAACAGAMLTATLIRNEPIYDSLRKRMLQSNIFTLRI
jgi:CIC family chloride channel protein